MTNLKFKLATSIATVSIMAAAVAPAAFAKTHVQIKNTGHWSYNSAHVKNINKTRVEQSNFNVVANLTGVLQNTGLNSANGNTGDGNVSADSGSATSNVTTRTTTNGNEAAKPACNKCDNDNTKVTIKNTGAGSDNTVSVKNINKHVVSQSNTSIVLNGTLVAQNTGGNSANGNTGDGNVDADSGNASSTVSYTTTTGGNVLNP